MWTIFYFKLYMTLLKVFKHSKTSVEVHRTKAKSSKWNGRQMDKFCFKKWPTSPVNFQLAKSFLIWIFLHRFVCCFALVIFCVYWFWWNIFQNLSDKRKNKMIIFALFLVYCELSMFRSRSCSLLICFSKNSNAIS